MLRENDLGYEDKSSSIITNVVEATSIIKGTALVTKSEKSLDTSNIIMEMVMISILKPQVPL